MWIEEQAAFTEGDLIGGDKPELLENGAPPWLQIGDSKSIMVMIPQGKLPPYLQPFPDSNFLIESGTKGPLISTTVRDRNGNLVVEIKRNHWKVYPPYCLDKNHTDLAFEARDSSGHVLLQLQIVGGPPRVQLQGEWWDNQGNGMRVLKTKDGERGETAFLGQRYQKNDQLIEPMFEYPSRTQLGNYHYRPILEFRKP